MATDRSMTIVLLAIVAAVPCYAASPEQVQCEKAADIAYQSCLAQGIPCVPQEPNCPTTPHRGNAAQCAAIYNSAYARCQPSFNWTPYTSASLPPPREVPAYWTDSLGNFWLFGGFDTLPPDLNDLWKFTRRSSTVGAWTQIPQSGTWPTMRHSPAFASDASGNLWLFGGQNGSGTLGDLWEFTPGKGWQLRSGSATALNQASVYPTSEGGAVMPGARSGAIAWTDANGNFWLFGGNAWYFVSGTSGATLQGPLNDLWMFSPGSGTWTFMGGAQMPHTMPGQPVTDCTSTSSPGGRYGASGWTDPNGNFWLYGGIGFDDTCNPNTLANPVLLNDLWEFSPTARTWTAGPGSLTGGQGVSYGTIAQASPSNTPGARAYATSWTDSHGNLWLYGGMNQSTSSGLYNDLWEYSRSAAEWIWISGPGGGPGARYGAAGWSAGFADFWIFGGFGQGILGDFWHGTGIVYDW